MIFLDKFILRKRAREEVVEQNTEIASREIVYTWTPELTESEEETKRLAALENTGTSRLLHELSALPNVIIDKTTPYNPTIFVLDRDEYGDKFTKIPILGQVYGSVLIGHVDVRPRAVEQDPELARKAFDIALKITEPQRGLPQISSKG